MLKGLRSAIYPVADVAAAKQWYEVLVGKPPYFDSDAYVGFEVGGFELGLLQSTDGASAKGVQTLWGVDDAEAAMARLQELGGHILSPVASVGGGIKTASITDPFGNQFGIIENPDFDIGTCG